jgi:hypothetical protein
VSVRELVKAAQAEMRRDDLPPIRARELLLQLTSLYGNCLEEQREADHAYAVVLLRFLDADEAANRSKIRAETSLEYLRKREADNTLKLVLELIRSIKVMLRSLDTEMREVAR